MMLKSLRDRILPSLQAIRDRRKPWLTALLIFINIGAFAFTVNQGLLNASLPEKVRILTNAGAFTKAANYGEYWRYITSMFLHLNLLHIGMNLLSLAYLGYVLEVNFKQDRLILLSTYLLSGAIANLGFFLTSGVHIGVGASGAICALSGYTLFLGLREYAQNPSKTNLKIATNTIVSILLICIAMPLLFPNAGIGHWVHSIGVLLGFLLAIVDYLDRRYRFKNLEVKENRLTKKDIAKFGISTIYSVLTLGFFGGVYYGMDYTSANYGTEGTILFISIVLLAGFLIDRVFTKINN